MIGPSAGLASAGLVTGNQFGGGSPPPARLNSLGVMPNVVLVCGNMAAFVAQQHGASAIVWGEARYGGGWMDSLVGGVVGWLGWLVGWVGR